MRPLKPLTVLRRLRKLFSVKERWTIGCYARDERGRDVAPEHPMATRWCLRGGAIKEDRDLTSGAWEMLKQQAGGEGPIYVNDHDGYEAVLALLDRTIERAKGET